MFFEIRKGQFVIKEGGFFLIISNYFNHSWRSDEFLLLTHNFTHKFYFTNTKYWAKWPEAIEPLKNSIWSESFLLMVILKLMFVHLCELFNRGKVLKTSRDYLVNWDFIYHVWKGPFFFLRFSWRGTFG